MSSSCEFALVADKGSFGRKLSDSIGCSSYQWSAAKGWSICVPEGSAVSSGRMAMRCPFDAVYIVGSEDAGYSCQVYKSKRCLYSTIADTAGQLPSSDLPMFYTCLIEIADAKLKRSIEKSELDGCANVFELFSRLGHPVNGGLNYKAISTEHDIYPQYKLYDSSNTENSSNFIMDSEIQAFGTMFVVEPEMETDYLVNLVSLDAVKKPSTVDLQELLDHETNSIGFFNANGRTIGFDIIGFEKCAEDWIDRLSNSRKLYLLFFNKYDRQSELIIIMSGVEQERFYFKNGVLSEYSCLKKDNCLRQKIASNNLSMPALLDYIGANIFADQKPIEFIEYCY